jgi:hypothetical protein
VGEVLRRDRQEAMDEPWQTLIGLLGQTLLCRSVEPRVSKPELVDPLKIPSS